MTSTGGIGGLTNTFKSERGSFLARQEGRNAAAASGNNNESAAASTLNINNQFDSLGINERGVKAQGSFGNRGAADALMGKTGGDRDWMNFASTGPRTTAMDRPTTASGSNAKVVHLEN